MKRNAIQETAAAFKPNPGEAEKKTERLQLILRPSTANALRYMAAEAGLSVNEFAGQLFAALEEREKSPAAKRSSSKKTRTGGHPDFR